MADILLFDPSTAKWTNLTAGGNIPAPRREHSAVLSTIYASVTFCECMMIDYFILGHDSSSLVVFGGGDPGKRKNSHIQWLFCRYLT
jgi:hypothetical protein